MRDKGIARLNARAALDPLRAVANVEIKTILASQPSTMYIAIVLACLDSAPTEADSTFQQLIGRNRHLADQPPQAPHLSN
jgi:hypothetical protein